MPCAISGFYLDVNEAFALRCYANVYWS